MRRHETGNDIDNWRNGTLLPRKKVNVRRSETGNDIDNWKNGTLLPRKKVNVRRPESWSDIDVYEFQKTERKKKSMSDVIKCKEH